MRERVINLGKLLVQELGIEAGNDTLSRWMAHYVAEQIEAAENATGNKKSKAEQRCFETVLKLWHHQSSLPNGRRPFESFEPILNVLNKLDPDSPLPFFCSPFNSTFNKTNDAPEPENENVQAWLDNVLKIDSAARVLIDFALKQAVNNASDEKTIAWLKNTVGLPSVEISFVDHILSADQKDIKNKEALEKVRQDQEERLKSKIEKLDAFSKVSSSLRTILANELEKLSPKKSETDVVDDS